MKGPHTGPGSHSAKVRRCNERRLLHALRRTGQASKADLARLTNLTTTAVDSYIAPLARAGLIEFPDRHVDGRRDQPALRVRLASRGAFGIGARLDRTRIETVLVDFAGQLLGRRVHDAALPHPADVLEIVQDDIHHLLQVLTAEERTRLAGVGVAQPHNAGSRQRESCLPSETFLVWDETRFAGELERALSLPVCSEYDGTAAAIAELFYGCGRHRDDFLYLFLGPAVGGGIAVDGDCLRGASAHAGDSRAMPSSPDRLASASRPMGRWDVLLSRASLDALSRHLRASGEAVEHRAGLEDCIARCQPTVDEWLDDCVDALAPALRAMVCVLDVPAIVVDADVDAGLIDKLIRRLRVALSADAPQARGAPRLLHGTFGAHAGALGAATLPMLFNFLPRAEMLPEPTESLDSMH
ncbi:ROK family transcriptional regulator [Paraburkholderia sp. A2WS-5]|uniref:ROK family transcriptional regulator n=1 Tax=unclassified Paraburkholderia TaxID=2615204 RepID=UPI003B79BC31